MSDCLWPHGLQLSKLPCPSPSPRACWNACPLCEWCHPTISSSVTPFSSGPQSFPSSGSFPVSWLFALGDQSIGASASALVLSMNIQDWFPSGLTGLILLSKGLLRVFSNTTVCITPHAKNWLLGKNPDAEKDWRQEEKMMTEDNMVGWHHWLSGSLSKLQVLEKEREAWHIAVHGVANSWTWLSNWTTITFLLYIFQFRGFTL